MSKVAHRAEMNEKITRKSEHEIARLKIRIEEKDRYIEKLKKDFERVFDELKHVKKDADKLNRYEGSARGGGS
jgi:predicted RNase H-like nuclease (RuvC/YqgF family)